MLGRLLRWINGVRHAPNCGTHLATRSGAILTRDARISHHSPHAGMWRGGLDELRALVLDPALLQTKGRRWPRRRNGSTASLPLEVRDIPTPVPPAPGWALVRPALAGICPSDLELMRTTGNPPVLAPYQRQGAVIPGHEVVGVVERSLGTRWAREGHRVLVEPTLRCVHKGLPECRRCRAGDGHLCENRDRAGALCSGSSVGTSERTGGGWSEGFLVHEDMLLPAEHISDQRGVLAEPAASALHAVLRWSRRGDRAVVVGTGSQAHLVVASLRRLHPDLEITVLDISDAADANRRARRKRGIDEQRPPDIQPFLNVGASDVRRGDPAQLMSTMAARLGARALRVPGSALPVLDGGVDVVFDCRGTAASTDLCVRLTRAGGTVVICAKSGRYELEWPLIWGRELAVFGAALYGRESNGHRTFAIVREWLTDPGFPIDSLVTHSFPLEEFEPAVRTAMGGTATGAVKVVFQGPVGTLRTRMEREQPQADAGSEEPLLLHASAVRSRAHRGA